MIDQKQIDEIKKTAGEFFEKMTLPALGVEARISGDYHETDRQEEEKKDVISLEINTGDPQILIGQGGQTLFEIQRILRMILNKKVGSFFYLNLDINDYKRQKVEYLKNMVRKLADQAIAEKEEKVLPPMSSYERRIIHSELIQRTDVSAESYGEGADRHIVIKPI